MLRIVVADDHTLFREAIKRVLSAEADIEVVGEAADAAAAIALADSLHPDIVLMDLGMPGTSSFEATRQIKQTSPKTRILFLSMYDDEDYLTRAMDSGASGYVLKDAPAQQLITALRQVSGGGSHLSPRMLSRLVENFRSGVKHPERVSRFGSLTPREHETLKMLAEGRSVKEIAGEFNLSVKTVEAHKFNLMRKLDIHNKAQLVQYAIQKKVINLDALRPQ
jgi:two-component system, NarL family, response regulator NreC